MSNLNALWLWSCAALLAALSAPVAAQQQSTDQAPPAVEQKMDKPADRAPEAMPKQDNKPADRAHEPVPNQDNAATQQKKQKQAKSKSNGSSGTVVR